MLKELAENPHHYKISAFFNFLQDKKKDRPRWWHTGNGQAKQTPFEVNVSTSIEHYITLGLALLYPFSTKGQVI